MAKTISDLLEAALFFCGCKYVENKQIDIAREIFSEKNFSLYLTNNGLEKLTYWKLDKEKYNSLNKRIEFAAKDENDRPIIMDKYAAMGDVDLSFYESIWAAKK